MVLLGSALALFAKAGLDVPIDAVVEGTAVVGVLALLMRMIRAARADHHAR